MSPYQLPSFDWREEAETFRRRGLIEAAAVLESLAQELEDWWSA